MQFIEDRLAELEQEKEELTDYEQLDKSRRALEYNLYDKELTKANQSLKELETNREEERENQQELYGRAREIQDELQLEEDNLLTSKSSYDRMMARHTTKTNELNTLLARKSALEVDVIEQSASIKANSLERQQLNQQLAEVNDSIQNTE